MWQQHDDAERSRCDPELGTPNTTLDNGDTAKRYKATLQLTGDGVASFSSRDVWFVVPSKACTPPVLL